MKSLNLRVYRRTLDNIALLWNQKALGAEAKKLEVYAVGEEQKLEFITSEQMEKVLEEGIIAPADTVVMMIPHELNKLDPYKDYDIQVVWGEGDNRQSHKIKVYAFGVLPPTEKDDKKLNNHMYGFYEEERKWVKLPVVRCKDGSFAVAVKLIKE